MKNYLVTLSNPLVGETAPMAFGNPHRKIWNVKAERPTVARSEIAAKLHQETGMTLQEAYLRLHARRG